VSANPGFCTGVGSSETELLDLTVPDITRSEDCTIPPARDPEGSVVNYVAVQREISRELGQESRLRQARKMASIGTLPSWSPSPGSASWPGTG